MADKSTAPLFVRSGSAILRRQPHTTRPNYISVLSCSDASPPARREGFLDAVLDLMNEHANRFEDDDGRANG